MTIISREAVRQAVARAMLLGGTQPEAVASAAEALGLPIDTVEDCVAIEFAGASDSEGGEPA